MRCVVVSTWVLACSYLLLLQVWLLTSHTCIHVDWAEQSANRYSCSQDFKEFQRLRMESGFILAPSWHLTHNLNFNKKEIALSCVRDDGRTCLKSALVTAQAIQWRWQNELYWKCHIHNTEATNIKSLVSVRKWTILTGDRRARWSSTDLFL
jgi:hypothetical protein